MTKFTARTIGTQDTAPQKLSATTLASAKIEASALLGDMFRGDELVVEYENQTGCPVMAASKTIGKTRWVDTLAAGYVE